MSVSNDSIAFELESSLGSRDAHTFAGTPPSGCMPAFSVDASVRSTSKLGYGRPPAPQHKGGISTGGDVNSGANDSGGSSNANRCGGGSAITGKTQQLLRSQLQRRIQQQQQLQQQQQRGPLRSSEEEASGPLPKCGPSLPSFHRTSSTNSSVNILGIEDDGKDEEEAEDAHNGNGTGSNANKSSDATCANDLANQVAPETTLRFLHVLRNVDASRRSSEDDEEARSEQRAPIFSRAGVAAAWAAPPPTAAGPSSSFAPYQQQQSSPQQRLRQLATSSSIPHSTGHKSDADASVTESIQFAMDNSTAADGTTDFDEEPMEAAQSPPRPQPPPRVQLPQRAQTLKVNRPPALTSFHPAVDPLPPSPLRSPAAPWSAKSNDADGSELIPTSHTRRPASSSSSQHGHVPDAPSQEVRARLELVSGGSGDARRQLSLPTGQDSLESEHRSHPLPRSDASGRPPNAAAARRGSPAVHHRNRNDAADHEEEELSSPLSPVRTRVLPAWRHGPSGGGGRRPLDSGAGGNDGAGGGGGGSFYNSHLRRPSDAFTSTSYGPGHDEALVTVSETTLTKGVVNPMSPAMPSSPSSSQQLGLQASPSGSLPVPLPLSPSLAATVAGAALPRGHGGDPLTRSARVYTSGSMDFTASVSGGELGRSTPMNGGGGAREKKDLMSGGAPLGNHHRDDGGRSGSGSGFNEAAASAPPPARAYRVPVHVDAQDRLVPSALAAPEASPPSSSSSLPLLAAAAAAAAAGEATSPRAANAVHANAVAAAAAPLPASASTPSLPSAPVTPEKQWTGWMVPTAAGVKERRPSPEREARRTTTVDAEGEGEGSPVSYDSHHHLHRSSRQHSQEQNEMQEDKSDRNKRHHTIHDNSNDEKHKSSSRHASREEARGGSGGNETPRAQRKLSLLEALRDAFFPGSRRGSAATVGDSDDPGDKAGRHGKHGRRTSGRNHKNTKKHKLEVTSGNLEGETHNGGNHVDGKRRHSSSVSHSDEVPSAFARGLTRLLHGLHRRSGSQSSSVAAAAAAAAAAMSRDAGSVDSNDGGQNRRESHNTNKSRNRSQVSEYATANDNNNNSSRSRSATTEKKAAPEGERQFIIEDNFLYTDGRSNCSDSAGDQQHYRRRVVGSSIDDLDLPPSLPPAPRQAHTPASLHPHQQEEPQQQQQQQQQRRRGRKTETGPNSPGHYAARRVSNEGDDEEVEDNDIHFQLETSGTVDSRTGGHDNLWPASKHPPQPRLQQQQRNHKGMAASPSATARASADDKKKTAESNTNSTATRHAHAGGGDHVGPNSASSTPLVRAVTMAGVSSSEHLPSRRGASPGWDSRNDNGSDDYDDYSSEDGEEGVTANRHRRHRDCVDGRAGSDEAGRNENRSRRGQCGMNTWGRASHAKRRQRRTLGPSTVSRGNDAADRASHRKWPQSFASTTVPHEAAAFLRAEQAANTFRVHETQAQEQLDRRRALMRAARAHARQLTAKAAAASPSPLAAVAVRRRQARAAPANETVCLTSGITAPTTSATSPRLAESLTLSPPATGGLARPSPPPHVSHSHMPQRFPQSSKGKSAVLVGPNPDVAIRRLTNRERRLARQLKMIDAKLRQSQRDSRADVSPSPPLAQRKRQLQKKPLDSLVPSSQSTPRKLTNPHQQQPKQQLQLKHRQRNGRRPSTLETLAAPVPSPIAPSPEPAPTAHRGPVLDVAAASKMPASVTSTACAGVSVASPMMSPFRATPKPARAATAATGRKSSHATYADGRTATPAAAAAATASSPAPKPSREKSFDSNGATATPDEEALLLQYMGLLVGRYYGTPVKTRDHDEREEGSDSGSARDTTSEKVNDSSDTEAESEASGRHGKNAKLARGTAATTAASPDHAVLDELMAHVRKAFCNRAVSEDGSAGRHDRGLANPIAAGAVFAAATAASVNAKSGVATPTATTTSPSALALSSSGRSSSTGGGARGDDAGVSEPVMATSTQRNDGDDDDDDDAMASEEAALRRMLAVADGILAARRRERSGATNATGKEIGALSPPSAVGTAFPDRSGDGEDVHELPPERPCPHDVGNGVHGQKLNVKSEEVPCASAPEPLYAAPTPQTLRRLQEQQQQLRQKEEAHLRRLASWLAFSPKVKPPPPPPRTQQRHQYTKDVDEGKPRTARTQKATCRDGRRSSVTPPPEQVLAYLNREGLTEVPEGPLLLPPPEPFPPPPSQQGVEWDSVDHRDGIDREETADRIHGRANRNGVSVNLEMGHAKDEDAQSLATAESEPPTTTAGPFLSAGARWAHQKPHASGFEHSNNSRNRHSMDSDSDNGHCRHSEAYADTMARGPLVSCPCSVREAEAASTQTASARTSTCSSSSSSSTGSQPPSPARVPAAICHRSSRESRTVSTQDGEQKKSEEAKSDDVRREGVEEERVKEREEGEAAKTMKPMVSAGGTADPREHSDASPPSGTEAGAATAAVAVNSPVSVNEDSKKEGDENEHFTVTFSAASSHKDDGEKAEEAVAPTAAAEEEEMEFNISDSKESSAQAHRDGSCRSCDGANDDHHHRNGGAGQQSMSNSHSSVHDGDQEASEPEAEKDAEGLHGSHKDEDEQEGEHEAVDGSFGQQPEPNEEPASNAAASTLSAKAKAHASTVADSDKKAGRTVVERQFSPQPPLPTACTDPSNAPAHDQVDAAAVTAATPTAPATAAIHGTASTCTSQPSPSPQSSAPLTPLRGILRVRVPSPAAAPAPTSTDASAHSPVYGGDGDGKIASTSCVKAASNTSNNGETREFDANISQREGGGSPTDSLSSSTAQRRVRFADHAIREVLIPSRCDLVARQGVEGTSDEEEGDGVHGKSGDEHGSGNGCGKNPSAAVACDDSPASPPSATSDAVGPHETAGAGGTSFDCGQARAAMRDATKHAIVEEQSAADSGEDDDGAFVVCTPAAPANAPSAIPNGDTAASGGMADVNGAWYHPQAQGAAGAAKHEFPQPTRSSASAAHSPPASPSLSGDHRSGDGSKGGSKSGAQTQDESPGPRVPAVVTRGADATAAQPSKRAPDATSDNANAHPTPNATAASPQQDTVEALLQRLNDLDVLLLHRFPRYFTTVGESTTSSGNSDTTHGVASGGPVQLRRSFSSPAASAPSPPPAQPSQPQSHSWFPSQQPQPPSSSAVTTRRPTHGAPPLSPPARSSLYSQSMERYGLAGLDGMSHLGHDGVVAGGIGSGGGFVGGGASSVWWSPPPASSAAVEGDTQLGWRAATVPSLSAATAYTPSSGPRRRGSSGSTRVAFRDET